MGSCCITRCQREKVTALVVAHPATRIKKLGFGSPNWFISVSAGQTITVTAVTRPNTAAAHSQVQWAGHLGSATNDNVVSICRDNAGGPNSITATLNGDKSINLYFIEIQSLECDNGHQVGATSTWKFYAKRGGRAEITATPNPSAKWYRSKLPWQWTNGTPGKSNRRRRVLLNQAQDTQVTVTLDNLSKDVTVHTCQVPELEVTKLTFTGGHTINNDTVVDFDNIWEAGRVALAIPSAANMQSPVCYTRNTNITITAEFGVTTQPTEPEQVTIRGTSKFKGVQLVWLANNVTINQGDATITVNDIASNQPIPNHVRLYENQQITWEVIGPDGVTRPAGQTTHHVYALLNNPIPGPGPGRPLYWTLAHISCKAAKGATTPDELVKRTYKQFTKNTGDAKGFRRCRDNLRLTYWGRGRNTGLNFNTASLLTGIFAEGRCGAWTFFFLDILKIHGVNGRVVVVQPRTPAVYFLVQKCKFRGRGSFNERFTHNGDQLAQEFIKQSGVAGQGKTNPMFCFPNHGMVEYNNEFYDPSYGSKIRPNFADWEKAAIAGLGHNTLCQFIQDGTPLTISTRCSKGFIVHTIQNVPDGPAGGRPETMDEVATQHGFRRGGNALFNHVYNDVIQALHPAAPGAVAAGDPVVIPRVGTNIVGMLGHAVHAYQ